MTRLCLPLLALSGILSSLTAQSWFSTDAQWYYDYTNLAIEGYTRVNVVSDTTVAGLDAKKLSVTQEVYEYAFGGRATYNLDPLLLREMDDIVYLYRNESWDTLLNFNAAVGDSWTLYDDYAPFPNVELTVQVHERTQVEYSGIMLTQMVLDYSFMYGENPTNEPSFTTQDVVLEYVGNTSMFIDPFDFLRNQLDFHSAGALRCYQDETLSYERENLPYDCDFVVRTQEPLIAAPTIFPNPATHHFTLQDLDGLQTLDLYDLAGRLQRTFDTRKYTHSIEGLPVGMYWLRGRTDEGVWSQRLLVQ